VGYEPKRRINNEGHAYVTHDMIDIERVDEEVVVTIEDKGLREEAVALLSGGRWKIKLTEEAGKDDEAEENLGNLHLAAPSKND